MKMVLGLCSLLFAWASAAAIELPDEPSLRLAPRMVEEIAVIVQDITWAGASILLVEQNAEMALVGGLPRPGRRAGGDRIEP